MFKQDLECHDGTCLHVIHEQDIIIKALVLIAKSPIQNWWPFCSADQNHLSEIYRGPKKLFV
jgi:hypothetical protein